MENNLVKILELNKNEELIEQITNLLKENNIEYKIDLEENWTTPYKYAKYIPKFSVYVAEKDVEKANELLAEIAEKNTVEDNGLLEEDSNDPTEKQAERVKIFRKICIVVFFVALIGLAVLAIVANNIQH